MKKIALLVLICFMFTGCSLVCQHKAQIETLLGAIDKGCIAAEVLVPTADPVWYEIDGIDKAAKAEMDAKCPSIVTSVGLASQLTTLLQQQAQKGYKLTK